IHPQQTFSQEPPSAVSLTQAHVATRWIIRLKEFFIRQTAYDNRDGIFYGFCITGTNLAGKLDGYRQFPGLEITGWKTDALDCIGRRYADMFASRHHISAHKGS
ncbi:MAG: hypothetical protein OSJ28_01285, partial [Desulfovibrio sp.]|nr:hypothetical protein [Desulfovibrio sp.]